mgnify:CR=1 FL=1
MKTHPDRATLQVEMSKHLQENITLMPIGNHHLKRHQVYKVISPSQPDRILKYHYLPQTFNRESQALSLLANKSLAVPELLWTDRYEDGRGLILMTMLPGISLTSALKLKDQTNTPLIFEQIGMLLGQLHKVNDISCAIDSPWNHLCLGTEGMITPATVQRERLEYLQQKQMPDENAIRYAIHYAKDLLDLGIREQSDLAPQNQWPLCHLDLDSRNCLVLKGEDGYALSGLLDFEHAQRFDPSADWASLWRSHFRDHRELFQATFNGYLKHQPHHRIDASFLQGIERQLLLQCLGGITWAKDIAPSYYKQCNEILVDGFNNRHTEKGFL